MSIATLPDETPVYIDGHGPATLGEVRHATEETPALSDWERTLNMWRDIAALNTNRRPWEPRVTVAEIRAYHASRSSNDPARLSPT